MDSKEAAKKKVNTVASGVQKPGYHSGRVHPPAEKVKDAKNDPSAQTRALKEIQDRQSGKCND